MQYVIYSIELTSYGQCDYIRNGLLTICIRYDATELVAGKTRIRVHRKGRASGTTLSRIHPGRGGISTGLPLVGQGTFTGSGDRELRLLTCGYGLIGRLGRDLRNDRQNCRI